MNKRQFTGTNVVVALSMILALLLTGCQSGPSAEEIVAKMKEVEASIEDAHGVIEVSVQAQGMDETVVVELWEKMPDKFRAEVLESSESEFVGTISVTDGSQAWMYSPYDNEAMVGELSESEMEDEIDPGQMIQMGSFKDLLPVGAQVAIAQVIGQDIYNIRRCLRKLCPGIFGNTGCKNQGQNHRGKVNSIFHHLGAKEINTQCTYFEP